MTLTSLSIVIAVGSGSVGMKTAERVDKATTIAPVESIATATEHSALWDTPLTIARCPFAAPALPAEAEIALDATLLVRVPEGVGSAVMVSPDGFALTAAHVVGTHDRVRVVAHGGAELGAEVVRVNAEQDIALVKVDVGSDSSCLSAQEGTAKLGSDVFILGSPAGEELSFSISKGIVSGHRDFDDVRFMQLDASVNPGNSGGPVVNNQGHIVGIASWKLSHVSVEGLAFAVPVGVGIDALGLQFGKRSDDQWRQHSGRVRPEEGRPSSPSGIERPPGKAFSPAQVRRDQLRRGLVIGGAVSIGVGVSAIGITAIVNATYDRFRERGWNALRGVNTAGWVVSFGGAALLTAGLVIPKKVKTKGGAELSLAPFPQGLAVSGRF